MPESVAERVSHTPGPWEVFHRAKQFWVLAANKETICRIQQWKPEIDEIDANLIAAAPDMLAALQAMKLAALYQCAGHAREATEAVREEANAKFTAALDLARAAIAKAEGRDV